MIMTNNAIIYVFFVAACLKVAFSCDGYELVIHYARNCGTNDVIQLENPGATLSKDCILTHYGCSYISQPISKILVHYKAELQPVLNREGDADICAKMETLDENRLSRMREYNVPTSCPMGPQRICAQPEKAINITRFKDKLGLLMNPIKVRATLDHGDAGTSCIELSAQMKRNGIFGMFDAEKYKEYIKE